MALRILFLLALFVATPAAFAQQEGAEEFERGLAEVRDAVRERQWERGRELLLALVARHPEAPYVRARRADILADLRRCRFWASHEQPDLDELVSGDLLSYEPSSGRVRLRYEASDLDDFETPQVGVRLHPAVFTDTVTVEVEGTVDDLSGLQLLVGLTPGGHHRVLVGGLSGVIGFKHSLHEQTGEATEELASKDPRRLDGDREVTAKVVLSKRRVKFSYAGGSVFSEARDAGAFGRVGFVRLASRFDRMTISGEIERGWLDGLADAALHEEWATFDALYDPATELPDWLADPGREEEPVSSTDLAFLAAVFTHPADEGRWRELELLRAQGDFEKALEMLERLNDDRSSAGFRAFALAIVLSDLERPTEAWAHLEELETIAPPSVPLGVLRAKLLFQRRDVRSAISTYEALVRDHPARLDPYRGLLQIYLREGRTSEAKAVVDRALVACPPSADLDAAAALLGRALRGPDWETVHEWEKGRYLVRSDMNRKVCVMVARELESALERFEEILGPIPEDHGELFRVYVFSGSSGYRAYCESLGTANAEQTIGLYTPALRQLLICNLSEREEMLSTVRHEGFHQYFDLVARDAPPWLNEGLAEYFEASFRDKRDFVEGRVAPEHLQLLERRRRLTPLSTLLYLSQDRLMARGASGYAHSWAFVHFLRNSGPERRVLFDRLFQRLKDGMPWRRAVEDTFHGVDLKEMGEEWRGYVEGLG